MFLYLILAFGIISHIILSQLFKRLFNTKHMLGDTVILTLIFLGMYLFIMDLIRSQQISVSLLIIASLSLLAHARYKIIKGRL